MLSKFTTAAAPAALLALVLASAPAFARDQIRVVGSSTVYPFTTAVAEQFGKSGAGKTPVVESTGTGGGMKIFCEGVGVNTPDATNASRRMKKGEFEQCQKNGVKDIVEIKIGFDALTLAHSKRGQPMKLTSEQFFLALAEQIPGADGKLVNNPHKNWSDVDKSLPNIKIEVLGPPPTSGTRDSMHELFMETGAKQNKAMDAIRKADAKAFDKAWKSVRKDGAFVEAGENDNVIVQKLEANPNAFGVFGYSFLEENLAKLQGVSFDGIAPSAESVNNGKYVGARAMFVYVKKAHIGVVPGLDKFAAEYVSDKALADGGYLERKGLVSLAKEDLANVRKAVLASTPMSGEGLPN